MDLNLKEIFEKDIDRPIDSVIKADDEESILNELEEYVITNELEKHFNRFFQEYNNYTNKNGVWISGFFGSGKSHLLKILSLLYLGELIILLSVTFLCTPEIKSLEEGNFLCISRAFSILHLSPVKTAIASNCYGKR